jgi:hypothetical protein
VTVTNVENALWVDWRRVRPGELPAAARIYFGHETCQYLLPPPRIALELARAAHGCGARVTLACPFVTEAELASAMRLIEKLGAVLGELEVSASDWGLLSRLKGTGAVPVLGRLLTAQVTDPRLARLLAAATADVAEREVMHADGTHCVLRRRAPTAALARHYRGVWCDRPAAARLLAVLGIGRCELSIPAHGLELESTSTVRYSLHTPEVLVATMRRCPGEGENLDGVRPCLPDWCRGTEVRWQCDGADIELIRRDNALYHRVPVPPAELASPPVDRIVHHSVTAGCSALSPGPRAPGPGPRNGPGRRL